MSHRPWINAGLKIAPETGAHLLRLQRYARCLAEEANALPAFAGQIDANFIDMLECCVPLHDIGQAALPDHILRKAGKLDHEERLIMQTHTTLGADILQGIARKHRFALTLLQMAADIARHHHEGYDGRGYPDRLEGNATVNGQPSCNVRMPPSCQPPSTKSTGPP